MHFENWKYLRRPASQGTFEAILADLETEFKGYSKKETGTIDETLISNEDKKSESNERKFL